MKIQGEFQVISKKVVAIEVDDDLVNILMDKNYIGTPSETKAQEIIIDKLNSAFCDTNSTNYSIENVYIDDGRLLICC